LFYCSFILLLEQLCGPLYVQHFLKISDKDLTGIDRCTVTERQLSVMRNVQCNAVSVYHKVKYNWRWVSWQI